MIQSIDANYPYSHNFLPFHHHTSSPPKTINRDLTSKLSRSAYPSHLQYNLRHPLIKSKCRSSIVSQWRFYKMFSPTSHPSTSCTCPISRITLTRLYCLFCTKTHVCSPAPRRKTIKPVLQEATGSRSPLPSSYSFEP